MYFLFLSQQLPGRECYWVCQNIMLEEECRCVLPNYPLCSTRNQAKNNLRPRQTLSYLRKAHVYTDLLLHRSCSNFVNSPFLNHSKFDFGPNMYRRLKWKFFFEHPSVRDLVEFICLPVSRRNLGGPIFRCFFFLVLYCR